MKLLSADLHKNVATHFPSCQTLLEERKSIEFSTFVEKLNNVSKEFYVRFAKFNLMKKEIEFFSNPIEIEIEAQGSEFQLELCDLQADPFLLFKKNERNEAFWKLVSNELFLVLRAFSLRMLLIFGSAYICESTFSVMKTLKSNTRNRLADETLDVCLQLATTEVDVDIEVLIKNA